MFWKSLGTKTHSQPRVDSAEMGSPGGKGACHLQQGPGTGQALANRQLPWPGRVGKAGAEGEVQKDRPEPRLGGVSSQQGEPAAVPFVLHLGALGATDGRKDLRDK